MASPAQKIEVFLSVDTKPDPVCFLLKREYLDYAINKLGSTQDLLSKGNNENVTLPINPNNPLTIFYGDMNNLKDMNDKHGHPAGDKLILLQGIIIRLGLLGPSSILEDETLDKFRQLIGPLKGMDKFVKILEDVENWQDTDGSLFFKNKSLPKTNIDKPIEHNFCSRSGGDELLGVTHGFTEVEAKEACERIDKISEHINRALKLIEEVEGPNGKLEMPPEIHFALGTAWTDGKVNKIIRYNEDKKHYEVIKPAYGDLYISPDNIIAMADEEMRNDKNSRWKAGREKIANERTLGLLNVLLKKAGEVITFDLLKNAVVEAGLSIDFKLNNTEEDLEQIST